MDLLLIIAANCAVCAKCVSGNVFLGTAPKEVFGCGPWQCGIAACVFSLTRKVYEQPKQSEVSKFLTC